MKDTVRWRWQYAAGASDLSEKDYAGRAGDFGEELSADSPLRVKVSEIGGIAPFFRTPTVRYVRHRPSRNGSVNGSPLDLVYKIPINRRELEKLIH